MDIDFKQNMQQAINFAKEKNPIWPFSALLIDTNHPAMDILSYDIRDFYQVNLPL